MKNYLIFFCFCFALSQQVVAQNTTLLTEPDSIKLPQDYSTFLSDNMNKIFDVNRLLKQGLYDFSSGQSAYSTTDFSYTFFPIRHLEMVAKNNSGDDLPVFLQLKSLLFANKALFEPLYAALIPLYKERFLMMPPIEKEMTLDAIKSGLSYAKRFNLEKEQADEKKLEYAFVGTKGNFQAFIYRRIVAGELTKEECIYWIEKIYKDLAALPQEANRREEEYIVSSKIAGPYYWAYRLDGDENAFSEPMEKTATGFKLVLPEFSAVVNSGSMYGYEPGLPYIYVVQAGGKKELVLFHANNPDSTKIMERITVESPVLDVISSNRFALLGYEDETAEIWELKTDAKGNKKVQKLPFPSPIDFYNSRVTNDFIVAQSRDRAAELLYFTETASGTELQRKALDKKVEQTLDAYNASPILIIYEDKSCEFFRLNGNELQRKSVPKFPYYSFEKCKNVFVLSTMEESAASNYGYKYKSGVLDAAGNTLFEPKLDLVLNLQNFNIILAKKETSGKEFYALYDSNMLELTPFVYEFENKAESDKIMYYPEEVLNSIILYKNKYKKNKKKSAKAVVFDANGKLIIPEKYPYIQRKFIHDLLPVSYYAVCDKAKIENGLVIATGKYALFNDKGVQLTAFEYDFIGDFEAQGYFPCQKNGQSVKVNKSGKEL